MTIRGITNSDMSATINGAIKAGWVHLGTRPSHTVGQIQWPATGAVVNYSTTPKAGGWKTTAQMIYAASGVDLRRKGSNRRSRKNFSATKSDPEVEASRRRHADAFQARADERDSARAEELARQESSRRAAAADRRRREIEELMR